MKYFIVTMLLYGEHLPDQLIYFLEHKNDKTLGLRRLKDEEKKLLSRQITGLRVQNRSSTTVVKAS